MIYKIVEAVIGYSVYLHIFQRDAVALGVDDHYIVGGKVADINLNKVVRGLDSSGSEALLLSCFILRDIMSVIIICGGVYLVFLLGLDKAVEAQHRAVAPPVVIGVEVVDVQLVDVLADDPNIIIVRLGLITEGYGVGVKNDSLGIRELLTGLRIDFIFLDSAAGLESNIRKVDCVSGVELPGKGGLVIGGNTHLIFKDILILSRDLFDLPGLYKVRVGHIEGEGAVANELIKSGYGELDIAGVDAPFQVKGEHCFKDRVLVLIFLKGKLCLVVGESDLS